MISAMRPTTPRDFRPTRSIRLSRRQFGLSILKGFRWQSPIARGTFWQSGKRLSPLSRIPSGLLRWLEPVAFSVTIRRLFLHERFASSARRTSRPASTSFPTERSTASRTPTAAVLSTWLSIPVSVFLAPRLSGNSRSETRSMPAFLLASLMIVCPAMENHGRVAAGTLYRQIHGSL